MPIKLSSLAVSSTEDGTWEFSKEAFPDDPEVSFKVRPISYPAFTIARDQMQQRLKRQHGGKTIPPHVMSPALGKLVAEHLLLDWKGFDQDYSKELALNLLTDTEFSQLLSAVIEAAIAAATAKVEYTDDVAKN